MASPSNTATGASGAVTLNTSTGVITTESLTLAAAANLDYVVTCSEALAGSVIVAVVSATTDDATENVIVCSVKPAAGSFTVRLVNVGATTLDESITFSYAIFN